MSILAIFGYLFCGAIVLYIYTYLIASAVFVAKQTSTRLLNSLLQQQLDLITKITDKQNGRNTDNNKPDVQ
jgi:dihydroorotate dehydrogenase